MVQDQNPEYSRYDSQSPRFTEKCLDPENVAYLCAKSPPPAIITPPASADWESTSAEIVLGSEQDVVMGGGLSRESHFFDPMGEQG